ncbi:MAG: cytochrome c maturation protein CcmE [Acidimicrobiales bacterium]|nr:cytochrome c maturation protein CcmE [Acidimicrobiales bacterium]
MDELSPDAPDPVGEPAGDDAASRLAPRVPPAARSRRRNPFALASLVLIVVALVAVVMMGLGDAAVFFRNADEAVAQRAELGDRRFRIQGLVDGDTVTDTTRGVDFVITHNGVEVTVAHEGDPPDLFQPGIPVVLEGRWARVDAPDLVAPVDALPTDDGWYFASDRFFVKHTEVYAEEHPERTDGYEGERGGSEAGPGR